MTALYAPESYWVASNSDRKKVCNGCGSKGFGWLVPNTIWGLSIKDCCDIHDWMYEEGFDIEAKEKADRTFINNMLRKIKDASKWLRWLRRKRAMKYYGVVVNFGGSSFWRGKNKPETMGEI